MHEHEFKIDEPLVRKLLNNQFSEWAHLPLKQVKSHGTDNAIFRLGTDMCVRLPRIDWAAKDAIKEQKLLSHLELLPLAVPKSLGIGNPDSDYPWHWSIYNWLDGNNACDEQITDPDLAAGQLVDFLRALRQIDPTNVAPSRRGLPLISQDQEVQKALSLLKGLIDTDLANAKWKKCLTAPIWQGPPTWLHGDLLPGNLLVKDGKLSAVIDWGLSGIGDPACDLIVAWSLFSVGNRKNFRNLMAVDDHMWARGMGWALSISLIILPYYWNSNPWLVSIAKRMLNEVLLDALLDR